MANHKNSKLTRRSSVKSLTPKKLFVVTLIVNGVLVGALFVLSCLDIVLYRKDYFKCNDSKLSVVPSAWSEEQARRYCFEVRDAAACQERGYHVKLGTNNDSVCCHHLGHHVLAIFQKAFINRYREDASRVAVLNSVKANTAALLSNPGTLYVRPAAHVGIVRNGNTTGPDSDAPRIQWEKSGETSFVTGDLVHGGDRIRITTPGYYYVYTGLQFDVTGGPNGPAIVAFLYRHENGTDQSQRKLMTTRESSCTMTRDKTAGPVSMHMSGIYWLRAWDEISVRTSSQSLLHRNPVTTYLGIHMV